MTDQRDQNRRRVGAASQRDGLDHDAAEAARSLGDTPDTTGRSARREATGHVQVPEALRGFDLGVWATQVAAALRRAFPTIAGDQEAMAPAIRSGDAAPQPVTDGESERRTDGPAIDVAPQALMSTWSGPPTVLPRPRNGADPVLGDPPFGYRWSIVSPGSVVRVLGPGDPPPQRGDVVRLAPGPLAEQHLVRDLFDAVARRPCPWSELLELARTRFPHESWTKRRLECLLRRRAYVGAQVMWTGATVPRSAPLDSGADGPDVDPRPSHAPLVSASVFVAAQRRLVQRAHATDVRSHDYPMTGLIVCGDCGAPYGGVSRSPWTRSASGQGTARETAIDVASSARGGAAGRKPAGDTAVTTAVSGSGTAPPGGLGDRGRLMRGRQLAFFYYDSGYDRTGARHCAGGPGRVPADHVEAAILAALAPLIATPVVQTALALALQGGDTPHGEPRDRDDLPAAQAAAPRDAELQGTLPPIDAWVGRLTGREWRMAIEPWLHHAVFNKHDRTLVVHLRLPPAVAAQCRGEDALTPAMPASAALGECPSDSARHHTRPGAAPRAFVVTGILTDAPAGLQTVVVQFPPTRPARRHR